MKEVWPVHSKEIESRRWNSFNYSPVRRSSSSLTSHGGSCHFAVLRNSLIWLALGPPTSSVPAVATPSASVNPKAFKARETCLLAWLVLDSHCRNVSVLPRNSLSVTVTTRGPESQLCSARMQFAANVHAFTPHVGPLWKKSSPCTRM